MRYIETIKIVNGTILNIELHEQRILRSIGRAIDLNLSIPPKYSVGVVKMRIVYDYDKIHSINFYNYILPKINTLKLVCCDDIDYHLKYENRDSINELTAQRRGCDDILIIKNNLVSDTSFCNVIFKNDNGLFTPKTPLLKGVKRQRLIERGIIRELDIAKDNILSYNKIYLVNAMIEIGEVEIDVVNCIRNGMKFSCR